ncbi:MAG: glutamate racemase [Actinomycetia bacterium]|nr:glutamate racemase [Actinomycetes bacterium]
MSSRPIAMFDSGFGGLTVARAVIDLLPTQDLVYFGDTGRYPYGSRPLAEVHEFAMQIGSMLRHDYNAKLLVVACNTASAAALDDLRAELDIPVVGVIEPGIVAAAEGSHSGKVGVVGTVGTIDSGAYPHAIEENDLPIELTACACPGFVEFVERGETDGAGVHLLAQRLLEPVIHAEVDTLLLGCTHYPYLARTIGDVMGREVLLVSSADETAFEVRRLLVEDSCPGRVGRRRFISSGDASVFETIGRRLFGAELVGATEHRWDI